MRNDKKRIKYISLFLAFALVSACFFSCAGGNADETPQSSETAVSETPQSGAQTAESSETPADPSEEAIPSEEPQSEEETAEESADQSEKGGRR